MVGLMKITSTSKEEVKTYLKSYNLSKLYYKTTLANIATAMGGIVLALFYGFPLRYYDFMAYIGYFAFILSSVLAVLNFKRYRALKKGMPKE